MSESQNSEQRLRATGGLVAPVLLFVLGLAAFVIQSSLTQYVQGHLGFRQPFFLLYFAHTLFIIVFPIHLLYLKLTSGKPSHTHVTILRQALRRRLLSPGKEEEDFLEDQTKIPTARFFVLILALTAGINIPGLLWYASVSLASISDVTAIWNTNSFWVYVLSVWIYKMKWQWRKLGAVLLATIGVILVVYGGATATSTTGSSSYAPTSPILGDFLTLVASISYALYQIMYKRYAALPSPTDAEMTKDGDNERRLSAYTSSPESTTLLHDDEDGNTTTFEENTPLPIIPESPPFGFYSNFIISCLGLCTAITLSVGFPILHWLSLEPFRLPSDGLTVLGVVGIATAGLTFNTCFMILLGIWGPILVSVGNVLTIVLVLITDVIFNHGTVTLWSLLGSSMIVSAFAVLAFNMLRSK